LKVEQLNGEVSSTDEDTPHLVNSHCAITLANSVALVVFQSVFEAGAKTNHNNGASELNTSLVRIIKAVEIPPYLTEALHGENGTHHSSSPLSGGEPRHVSPGPQETQV
jgi:hypothetical protein